MLLFVTLVWDRRKKWIDGKPSARVCVWCHRGDTTEASKVGLCALVSRQSGTAIARPHFVVDTSPPPHIYTGRLNAAKTRTQIRVKQRKMNISG